MALGMVRDFEGDCVYIHAYTFPLFLGTLIKPKKAVNQVKIRNRHAYMQIRT
jgi:hypothetical protein